MSSDGGGGQGYKELLAVFLAVAVSTMTARLAGIDFSAESGWQQAEIVLFSFVYIALRVKWYLDDVKEDRIKLSKPGKGASAGISSHLLLVFSIASWVAWLLAAFYFPEKIRAAYIALGAGVGAGSFALWCYGHLSKKCQCCFITFNVFYMAFMFTAAGTGAREARVLCLGFAAGLFCIDAFFSRSFMVFCDKSKDNY